MPVFFVVSIISINRMFPLCYNSIDSPLIISNHCTIYYPFLEFIYSTKHPSLLSKSESGITAYTGLHASGFLWTRHFPKITWAKDFHSWAGRGLAKAACLMGNRRKKS